MDVYIYIMYLTLLFFSGITIFLFCFTKHKSYTKSLPPGPSPLPIFGNLMALLPHISTPHKYFAKLAKTYGPIVSLQLGSITAIVISTPTLAKQVHHKNHSIFSTLYDLDAIGAHQHDEFSIGPLSPKSPKWKILRKIYSTQLLSEKMMENMKFHRYKKMEELMGYVRKCALDNISVDVGEAVFDTSFDMICSSIFSMDSGTDSRIREIKNLMNGIITEIGRPNIVDCYPILKTIDPQRIRHRLTYYCVDLFNLFDEIIAQRLKCSEEKLRSSDVYSDLMDVILDVAEEQKDEITRDHVHHLLLDLLGAGMDTTSKTMEWAMAELLGNPMMLTKLQQEIDKVVGKAKFVFESDISELPYLQAIVKETLRLHPAAPLLLPRKVEQDIQIEGYQLPKGAMLIVNAWAIGRDPESWADPDTFYPERFLGSELDMKSQFLKLFTFGAGKKICVGMPLALRMISLVLGNLINCFDWKLLHKQNLGMEYDMSDQYGIKILMCLSGYSFLISFVGIARLCL